jgi:DNA polymerase-3 subunit alpha
LIVQDFINFAKSKQIVVGPGRGSAAGSIIAYCLRITELDPLRYGLIFERFLNPERISMPDIDIDFEDDRRDEVLDYVVEKYGRNSVAQIITFGTMAAKAAIRDVGRALGYPYIEVDRIAKLIPPPVLGKYSPLQEYIDTDPELSRVYASEPRTKVLLDNAVKLEGSVRHVGTHACAVIIADQDLTEYTVLQRPAGQDEGIVTQFSMNPLEALGLLKMDFLGLKNLTIIRKTKELIETRHDVEIDLDNLNLSDTKAFKLLQRGETTGVFQLESAGMRRYLKDLKPTELADIIAMNALYRPGPMQYIPQYINGKHDPKSVKYLDQSFEDILSETYGVAVYQEQVLLIAQNFAGFTLGQADILRKAVGKKIPALLAEQRVKFVEGAVKKGHSEKFAKKVFDEVVEPFAGYGFNKAHAACYGYIAFLTAYLKAHYPAEFMATLLTADQDNTDRVVFEINECKLMGIDVLPPSINHSYTDFTVVDERTIRFGLGAIKGVGASTVSEIIQIREENGEFQSIQEIAKRVPAKLLNKKVIEALSYSGALDSFGDRSVLAQSYEEISDYAKDFQKSNDQNQTDIFGMVEDSQADLKLKDVPKANYLQRLNFEKEYLGLFVSGHPLQGLEDYLGSKTKLLKNVTAKDLNKPLRFGGLITEPRKVMTKKGDYMMYFTLEDPTSKIDTVVFTRAYKQFGEMLEVGNFVFIDGKLDVRSNKYQLRADAVRTVSMNVLIENAKEKNMYHQDRKMVLSELIVEEAEDQDDEDNGISKKGKNDTQPNKKMSWKLKVPKNTNLKALEGIKKILLDHPGSGEVLIQIERRDQVQEIRVPFGVEINDSLKKEINAKIQENNN